MNKKSLNLMFALSFLPMIITFFLLGYVDDKIIAHFNIKGMVDRYGSKLELFIIPVLIILTAIAWILLLKSLNKKYSSADDPQLKSNFKSNYKVTMVCAIIVLIIYSLIQFYLLYVNIIKWFKIEILIY